MKSYQKFIGIDIGKFTFFVSQHGEKKVFEYENNPEGIQKFFQRLKHILGRVNEIGILPRGLFEPNEGSCKVEEA